MILLATLAWAQDAPPDPDDVQLGGEILVVGEGETTRVAGSAFEVDEEVLETFEYDDIEKVLSAVPGVSTRGEDGYGLRPNIGIRGANSDRSAKLTLMEDGVLLAPAPYAAPAAYYFPMATRMTAVEVFKGPAATRFGPQTVGGAVNMVTRAVPNEPEHYADVSVGVNRTLKAHAYGGASGDLGGVVVEGVWLQTDGFKELDTGGDTGFERSDVMLKGQLTPPGHGLELKLGFAHDDDRETYLGLTGADAEATPYRRYAASALAHMQWRRTQAELAWSTAVGDVELRTVAYHHYMTRQWFKLNGFASGVDLHSLLQTDPDSGQGAVYLAILRGEEDTTTGEQVLRIGLNDRRFHSAGVQTNARWEVVGDTVTNTLEGGVRLHLDHVVRQHSEDPFSMVGGELFHTGGETEVTLDSVATAHALSAHVHDDVQVGATHVLPGLRAEVVRGEREDEGAELLGPATRTALLPGLGVLFAPADTVNVFGGAYRGFSPVAPGQPAEVSPETSWNYEAGGRWTSGEARAEVVGFFNDYTNLTGDCTFSAGCDESEVGQQYNGGRVWIWGVEGIAGHGFVLPGAWILPVELTYAWTQSSFRTAFDSDFAQFGDVEFGDFLPYVAEHQGSARLGFEHPRVKATVGVTARTGMLDQAGTFPVEEGDVPALWLVDAALSGRLSERVSLYATGTNLNGSTAITSWRPFGARPVAPRTVMVGLKVSTPEPF